MQCKVVIAAQPVDLPRLGVILVMGFDVGRATERAGLLFQFSSLNEHRGVPAAVGFESLLRGEGVGFTPRSHVCSVAVAAVSAFEGGPPAQGAGLEVDSTVPFVFPFRVHNEVLIRYMDCFTRTMHGAGKASSKETVPPCGLRSVAATLAVVLPTVSSRTYSSGLPQPTVALSRGAVRAVVTVAYTVPLSSTAASASIKPVGGYPRLRSFTRPGHTRWRYTMQLCQVGHCMGPNPAIEIQSSCA